MMATGWAKLFVYALLGCAHGVDYEDDDSYFLQETDESENIHPESALAQTANISTTPDLSPFDSCPYDYCTKMNDLSPLKGSWYQDDVFIPTIVVYGVAFVLGVTGNILVVFALAGDRKAHNVTSSFLISLAVADLAFLLLCVPYEVGVKMHAEWLGGSWLCKGSAFMEMLTACASVLNLTAISIERYVVIVHPMKSRSLCTMGKMRKIIIFVWLLAALLSSPVLHTMSSSVHLFYNGDESIVRVTCMDHNLTSQTARILFAWYKLLVKFLLPLLAMLFCYTFVIHVLWVSNKQLARLTHTTGKSEDDTKQRLTPPGHSKAILARASNDHGADVREARSQVIKMLLTVIAVFLMCWGPALIFKVLKSHHLVLNDEGFYAGVVVNLLPYLQSCSNPIIYSFMSKNFRRSMCTACRTRCRPCHRLIHRPRKPQEYDMETKTNGASYGSQTKYSPSMSSSRPGKTLYTTVVSEYK